MGNEKEKTMSDQNLVDAFLKTLYQQLKAKLLNMEKLFMTAQKTLAGLLTIVVFFQTF